MYEFIEESLHAAGDPVHFFELNFICTIVSITYEKRVLRKVSVNGTNDAEKYSPESEKEGYQFEEVSSNPSTSTPAHKTYTSSLKPTA